MENNKILAYDNATLEETLGERNQVRTRPAVYFGTNDVQGCLNGVFEIVTNGTDEASALKKMGGVQNQGTYIKTIIQEDFDAIQHGDADGPYIVTVIDDGRGVPMDLNPKNGKYNWHLVYNQLFASGKRGSSGAYAGAAGLNGVGAAITQFTSEFMQVISRRIEAVNGKTVQIEYEMNFKDGEPVGELVKRAWRTGTENITGLTGTGTYVRYKTDRRFFLQTRYSFEMVADKLRKLATVSAGIKYELKFLDEEPLAFCFEHGSSDFLKEITIEPLIKEPITITAEQPVDDTFMGEKVKYNVSVSVALSFSNEQGYVESYHNSSYVPENGTHYLGVKDAVKEVLENFGQKEGKLAAKERILNADLDDIMCVICASSIDHGEYSAWSGQDKRAINNESLYGVFRMTVTEYLRNWLTSHKEEGLRVIQAIKLRKEAREKADQVKKKLVKQMAANPNELKSRPEKLHDCSSRNVAETELFIVEGDSAEGSAMTSRNVVTQATYPLTGVILNVEKASPEQIFNNRVIRELIQIFGCGIETPFNDKHFARIMKDLPKFNLAKLNYGKIIIMTDADVDGGHITCLLIVFIAKLMPDLLRAGKVFIAEAPLYKITYMNDTCKYAYSDAERDSLLSYAKNMGIKIKYINRYKGLGEMDADELAEAVMEPKTRRLTPVEFGDEEGFRKIMQDLLGNNLDERKAWIRDYFEMITEAEAEGELEYMMNNTDAE